MAFLLTVVIPTYNRKDILKKCLKALFTQTYPYSNYEVIVIDDGSTDGTRKMVKTMINDSPCKLRYFKQENKGPAAARNVGIRKSEGEIILFIGDDIVVKYTFIEEHIKFHKEHREKIAVLGFTKWPPDLKVTSFMDFITERGCQFGYSLIEDYKNVPYQFFYTSNISLPKEVVLEIGMFDNDFPFGAMEDIEFGYRLMKNNYRMIYNPEAKAYHYHPTSLKMFSRRQFQVGCSALIFSKKHPEKGVINLWELNKKIKRSHLYFLLSKILIPFLQCLKWKHFLYRCYGEVLQYHFFLGMKEQYLKNQINNKLAKKPTVKIDSL